MNPEASEVAAVAPVNPEASEVATVAPVNPEASVRAFDYVRAVASDVCMLTLAIITAAMRSVSKVGNVKFPFLHAKDGEYGNNGLSGRFTVRAVQCDPIGETIADGSRPVANFTFYGFVTDAFGNVVERYTRAYRLAVADAFIRVVTRDTAGGCDSLQGNASINTQTLNASRSRFTIIVGRDGSYALDATYHKGPNGGGGCYRLSVVTDSDGAPLAPF